MKIVEVTSKKVFFSNGDVLTYKHHQFCCESVFADFLVLKDYNALGKNANKTIFEVDFDENSIFSSIARVEVEGFKIRYTDGDFNGSVFVPCYNHGCCLGDLHLAYIRIT